MKWLYAKISDFTAEQLRHLRADLSPTRASRIDQFRRPEDQTRSLAAEFLTRKLLREGFGIAHPVLHAAPSGQPVLPGTGLFVSITHSGEYVACAVSEKPVGIDMEGIRSINLSMAKHVCTDEEMCYLFGHTPAAADFQICKDPKVLQRFFEIWTGKEAWFKMQGTGIQDLRSINILPLPRKIILRDGLMMTIIEKPFR